MVALAKQSNIWQEEPIAVKRGDLWTLGNHKLYCGDSTCAEDVAQLLHDESADLVFADPPYGMGIDVWDTKIADILSFLALSIQHLKQGGFFAFTCQMPYMLAWLNGMESSGLRYKDHIAWVKRNCTAVALPLIRTHESLFTYTYGKADYHATKGRYEDVKLPGVLVDIITLEGIDRYIKDLRIKARGGVPSHKVSTNLHDSYGYMDYEGRKKDGSPEYTNFTNVWSFLPDNQRNHNKGAIKHATAKPLLLMERLLALCTPENALVYDPFLGSGTTLIAAENVNRRCVGIEMSEQYCAGIIARWQAVTGQKAMMQGD